MAQYQTLPGLLKIRAQETPDHIAHWVMDVNGDWQPVSYRHFFGATLDLAWKLKALGIAKNQVVAIMATTSHVWELIHHAVLSLGGIVVGVDPNENAKQLDTIFSVANIQTLVIDQIEYLDKFTDTSQLTTIVAVNTKRSQNPLDKIKYIDISKTAPSLLTDQPLPNEAGPSDTATIIFTSGTTGTPKGIAYRHDQIIAAINAILLTYPELSRQPCHLACWLPLSNLFQRIVNLCALAGGAETFFVEQPQKIIEHLPTINPHIFIAVPRFYEKLYQGLEAKLNRLPWIVAQTLRYCLTHGEDQSTIGKLFRVANRRIFKSFTSIFGKNIRYMVSGSAAIPLWLLQRYRAMGLLILEAYGLSENVVPIAANSFSEYRFGTVGKALPGNSIALAKDGELLVKGTGVFDGYISNEQPEKYVFADGYLATGDYAEVDDQGYIRLTGRKSEVFKTSTGRKIAPVAIESILQNTPEVEHAVVFGENRKFLVALVTTGHPLPENEAAKFAYVQTVAAKLTHSVSILPEYKRPVGIVFSFKSLSLAEQELTTNLKLRRKNILLNYERWINELYASLENPKSAIHSQPISAQQDIVLLTL